MSDQNEIKTSQVVGGLIGAGVGNFQGATVGMAAATALMAAPLTGGLALLAIPVIFALPVAGAVAGTVVGAKAGSKGLSSALMMLLGSLPKGEE
jgi:outer membrane lipoprotein SlyB